MKILIILKKTTMKEV